MLTAESVSVRGLHAPLFEQVIRGLDEARRLVVFDCGAARSGTIAMLSPFRCRLDVFDLAAALPALESGADAAERRAVLTAHLAAADREPGQLVLCWNLLNYLKPGDITVLAEVLAPQLAPGARLHALIEYSSPVMPAAPGHWVPDAAARLHADQPEIEQMPSPRYSPKALERLMPPFRMVRSMLLGNGLQEHLFVLRD